MLADGGSGASTTGTSSGSISIGGGSAGALRRHAAQMGNEPLVADVDRIHAATERLDELLHHASVSPAPPP